VAATSVRVLALTEELNGAAIVLSVAAVPLAFKVVCQYEDTVLGANVPPLYCTKFVTVPGLYVTTDALNPPAVVFDNTKPLHLPAVSHPYEAVAPTNGTTSLKTGVEIFTGFLCQDNTAPVTPVPNETPQTRIGIKVVSFAANCMRVAAVVPFARYV
jgi:hypothetical protein